MKYCLILTFSIALFYHTHAQESSFGVKGGVNFSTTKLSDGLVTIIPDKAIKIHFGMLYTLMMSKKIALQPELLYNVIGHKPTGNSSFSKINIDYLTIPLNLKFYLTKKASMYFGASYSLLLRAKADEYDVRKEFKSYNKEVSIGGDILLGHTFGIGLRYNWGVTNISRNLFSQKTENIQLSFIYKSL